ncbi:universal stress protein [Devosia sp. 1635]|uniref:universal stress protein n=1 Tax=Devosia sp. 1635 TaxID=2726066 RepID=UPI001567B778|nr:universal stress protein [Devosia sp. 1635]
MIKNIVVHLTGSDQDQARLGVAESIGNRFDAHLTGLYVHILPETSDLDPIVMAGMEPWFEQSAARADESFKKLKTRFDDLGIPHDVRRLDVSSGAAGQAMAARARVADLFVAARPEEDPAEDVNMEVSVLFGSGRACLFVPQNGRHTNGFNRVTVAWDGSREAVRAITEAMPFLEQASQVIIVSLRQDEDALSAGDLARHLRRHGISAEVRTLDTDTEGSGEALLDEVGRTGANLLVMGGCGHSKFMDWVLGGATRYVLTHADIPVLMAR